MTRIYRELYRIPEPNGVRHVAIEESDGLFRYSAWKRVIEERYDGKTDACLQPILWSGLYESAQDAERSARAEFPWLSEEH